MHSNFVTLKVFKHTLVSSPSALLVRASSYSSSGDGKGEFGKRVNYSI